MNYAQSVDYVQNAALFDSKKDGLNNMHQLLNRLGNPHHGFQSVHVAGTNGKGSVCAMMESVLREAGYCTGLFTSPYLQVFTERIRLSGENVDPEIFAEAATRVRYHAEAMKTEGYNHPTFFELVTAIAFVIFQQQQVDIAIIEVGMGGLLDATNVLDPLVTVITSIGMDHVKVLGGTIDEIAAQKAGIIKPGCPVVVYPQPFTEAYARILSTALEQNAPVYSVAEANLIVQSMGIHGSRFTLNYGGMRGELNIPLLGRHQVMNAATAFLALVVLAQQNNYTLTAEHIVDGMGKTQWPGRMEVLSHDPLIIIDGAHNQQGAKALRESLRLLLPIGQVHLVLGMMGTKDMLSIIDEITDLAHTVYPVQPSDPRALEIEMLHQELMEREINSQPLGSVEDTLHAVTAKALQDGRPIVICGSLYLAGEVRTLLQEESTMK